MNPFRVCMVVLLSVWLPGSGMASEKTSFASLPVGVSRGAVILADFNGDGALDLFLSGLTAGATPMAKVYFFADQSVSDSLSFTGVVNSAAAVGDLDSDNDLDLLLTGMSQDSAVSRVYWMQDGLPADSTDLRGVFNSAAAVADLDNDGDLDLLLTGTCNADTAVSMIYRNQAGDFVLTPAPLPDVTRGAVAFADWDNDQDVDFLLTGWDEAQRKAIAWLYRNDNGHYEFERALKGVFDSAVAWGDYNDDGLVDLVLTGDTSQGADIITVIYRNTGDGFLQKQKLQGAATGDIAAGDFDNDGDLDFIIAGDNGPGGIAEMYENDTGTFHLAEFGLLPVTHSALAVGDYDDDGTLDVVLAGESQAGSPVTVLYRNPSSDIDSAPHPPQNLTATNKRDAIKLRWQPANDDRTPAEALTYNLQIGSLPGGVDVLSPGADLDSGQRKIFQMGNAWQNSAWTVRGLEEGTYSWRVQAIDHGFKPSRFSPEQHFLIDRTPPARPTLLEAIVDSAQVTLIWSRTPAPDLWQYRIYVRPEAGDFALRDSTFGDTSITIRDLTNEVETSFIVTAVDVSRNESDASNEIQATPFAVPFSDGFVPFPPLVQGDAAWGDYDSDGDLDLILTGLNGTLPVTRIYRNDLDAERFVLVNEALPGVYDSSVAWGDYDNDDDLDLLIAGETSDGSFISHIYENRRENGPPTFVLTPDRLLPIRSGAVAWCDFDNDGDLDAIVCGEGRESEPATRLYRNMGQPGFAELTTSMPGFKEST
ncbi:MAG: FG-GAP-like repeat-containing protein, partial [bacterium]